MADAKVAKKVETRRRAAVAHKARNEDDDAGSEDADSRARGNRDGKQEYGEGRRGGFREGRQSSKRSANRCSRLARRRREVDRAMEALKALVKRQRSDARNIAELAFMLSQEKGSYDQV